MAFIFLGNLEVMSLTRGRMGRRYWLLGKRKNMKQKSIEAKGLQSITDCLKDPVGVMNLSETR